MGLEVTVNTIADLVITNPADGDLASQGDNHIRLIKDAVKKTFPAVNAPLTATPAEFNKLAGLATTKVELGYVAGVTSAIQAQLDAMTAAFTAALAAVAVVKPGTISYTAAGTPDDGYIAANGTNVSRVTYAALFARIGTTYGVGDGATTFTLPDGRGVVPRGLDNGRGLDTGRVLGSYQADAVRNHTHTGTTSWGGDHTHDVLRRIGGLTTGGTVVNAIATTDTAGPVGGALYGAGGHNHTMTTGNPDSGGNAENRVKSIAWLCQIKT